MSHTSYDHGEADGGEGLKDQGRGVAEEGEGGAVGQRAQLAPEGRAVHLWWGVQGALEALIWQAADGTERCCVAWRWVAG